jgi:ABC-type sugar transport system ATPase subunit
MTAAEGPTAVVDAVEDAAPLALGGRLRAEGITHRYGGARALDDVTFEVAQGEIHALVGENGAGKSTLVKVITGAVRPTEGRLCIDDAAIDLGSPSDAQAEGIGVVHQDYNLFPHLSVATNIVGVSAVPGSRRGPMTDRGAMNDLARELMAGLGLELDPRRVVSGLGAAERKLVEIARAMVQRPRFLLLDEPTAALEPRETDRLLDVVSSLRDRGTGIILVSHRLGEICRIGNRATALRDGRVVGQLTRAELTPRALTVAMVGSEVEEHQGPGNEPGEVFLDVRGLRLRADVAPVEVQVREREIVALVGLVGSGCGQVLETIAGARRDRSCSISLSGSPVRLRTPADAVRLGIGYAPEDRKRLGLVMGRSVAENMGLASLERWSTASFSSRKALDQGAAEGRDLFDIRLRSLRQPVGSLSGGNQQKVLLARWRLADVRLLVLHEPSQGVDVSARRAIHDHLIDFAAQGGSVVFSSSDIDEVRAIAHRIYVFHAGEVTEVLTNTGPGRPSRTDVTEAVVVDPRTQGAVA